MTTNISVSEAIVRFLQRLEVGCVFGIPGAHILPVYDSLYASGIQTVLAKHEQGAAFMAGGYARVSGRISCCIATAGPGATNLVTGVANAYADRLPVLVLTGETPTHVFGKGGLQESSGEGGSIDQVGLFQSISRYAKVIERTHYLQQVLNQAAQILLSANPGPVVLSLPYDVQKEEVDASILEHIHFEPRRWSIHYPASQLRELVALICDSARPVIIAGHGALAAKAEDVITRLSRDYGIPVATSLKGKGIIDETDLLSLGTLGVTSGGLAYEYITQSADLILFVGAGFNERTSYLWDEQLLRGKRLVQIDQDPMRLGRVFRADLAINADIHDLLSGLLQSMQGQVRPAEVVAATRESVALMRATTNSGYSLFQAGFSLQERLFKRLAEALPSACVLFDDNIIFAQNFYPVRRGNRYYPNTGISSLGHAIPAAIGAQFHRQGPTFAILGDGGFQMCCMELMTAVNYQIPLNVILFNNATMGLIRKNQAQHYGGRYISSDFINPDFARLAESFGIHHILVRDADDIDRLFATVDLHNSINLIEILIDRDAFPNYSSKR